MSDLHSEISSKEEEKSPSSNSFDEIVSFLEITWSKRRKIILIVFIISVVTAGISLVLPKSYTAEAVILPDIDFLSSLQDKLGGLQDLASAAGLSGLSNSPSQLYPDIMTSETVLRKVIFHKYKSEDSDSLVNLIEYWKYDDPDPNWNFERAITKMQKSVVNVTVDKKTMIMTLTVEIGEKQLAADIANQITAELDYFQRNFRRTNASEQRKFLELRLGEVKDDLAKAEDKLKTFRENNRRVEQSPQLMLEQDRLGRDVEINTAIFIELKKQYELAKLDEIKNTPIVQVLDPARPPAKRTSPKRTILVLFVAFFTTVLTISWEYGREVIKKYPKASQSVARLGNLFRKKQGDHVLEKSINGA